MVLDDDKLRVERAALDGSDVITLIGEIDIATAASLDSALTGVASKDLVVDLQGVSFMDSTGLHSLLKAKNRIHANGGQTRLVLGKAVHIRRLLDAAGLLDQFLIQDGHSDQSPE